MSVDKEVYSEQTRKSQKELSNKKAELLKVVPKGQPEGLSVMVVQREQRDMLD